MGLLRLLAGALLVLWLFRLVRRVLAPVERGRPRAQGGRRRRRRGYDDDGIEEADYEELP